MALNTSVNLSGVRPSLQSGNGTRAAANLSTPPPALLPVSVYSTGGNDNVLPEPANWFAVADVNGDGKPDLIVANSCTQPKACPPAHGTVGVLLGNGEGRFQPAVTHDSGGYFAFSVLVGDANGDGKPDLFVANKCIDPYGVSCIGPSYLGILLGNGDGTFQPVKAFATGATTSSMTLADVDNDGKIDVVVTNRSDCTNPGASGIGVLLGNGDGTFRTVETFSSLGILPTNLVAADVNGDGDLDLVVMNSPICGTGNGTGGIGVFLGNGDGTFHPSFQNDRGVWDYVVVADMNHDGKPDLLATTLTVGSSVEVFLGNGDGAFQPPVGYDTGGQYGAPVTVLDLNGDGNPDILAINGSSCLLNSGKGCIGVLLGNGDGTFRPVTTYLCGGAGGCDSLAVADIDGDGHVDLVVSNSIGKLQAQTNGSVGLLLGNGDGTFRPVTTYDSGGINTAWVAVADVNLDDKPDVLVGNPSGTGGPIGFLGVLVNNTSSRHDPTTTTITASRNPVLYQQKVTYTATVTSQMQNTDPAAGTMIFREGAKVLASVPVNAGQAVFTTEYPEIPAGTHAITASYSGDAHHGRSQSAVFSEYVLATTRVLLTTSGSPSHSGQSVTFTATVTSQHGVILDGGRVRFYDGQTALGSSKILNGIARYTTSSLSKKDHLIRAVYPGNLNLKRSTGYVAQLVTR